MQVQLKQTEIIAALKQFITSQGINLAGKDVSITFTAGRKEAGIIADVSIEDVTIPGFTDSEVEEAIKATEAPALSVVKNAPVAKPEVAEPAPAETPEPAASGDEPAPKTTSLFN